MLCRMLQSSDDANPSVAILAQETSVRFSRQAPNTVYCMPSEIIVVVIVVVLGSLVVIVVVTQIYMS